MRRPAAAETFVGAGEWRKHLFNDEREWPSSWTNFERAKYLSSALDRETRLFEFDGYGHYGDDLFEREKLVSEAGFGPTPSREAHGFVSFPRLNARPMSHRDLNDAVLARLAEYCAFRERNSRVALSNIDGLHHMAEHNLAQLELDLPVYLHLERPVIADARMQPHEWLLSPNGDIWKTDSGSHGDDHFFPGPTDIAWDLAGAMIEWSMDDAQSEAFLSRYRLLSGDNAATRMNDHIIAYSAFRCAYCLMAANALPGTSENARLQQSAELYRGELARRSGVAVAGY
jgi:hypothetical protein